MNFSTYNPSLQCNAKRHVYDLLCRGRAYQSERKEFPIFIKKFVWNFDFKDSRFFPKNFCFFFPRIKIQIRIPHILIPCIIPLRSVQFRSLVNISIYYSNLQLYCNTNEMTKKNCWNGLCYPAVRKFMNIQYESKAWKPW